MDNGENAIYELNSNYNIDTVILDLKVPKYNGKEILKKIDNYKF